MGTTKIKLGIIAYKNIPASTITDLLPHKGSYHSLAWNQQQELIWYIKVSKWMNDQFELLIDSLQKIAQEQKELLYKSISFESSTDIIGHAVGQITCRTSQQTLLKENIDLYQPTELPHHWATLLDYITLDNPITFGTAQQAFENYQPAPENSLLLCYLGEEENQLTAAIINKEEQAAYSSSQEPAAIETFQCTNGYPYLFTSIKNLDDWEEVLATLPFSEGNRVLIFEYNKESMALFPCLLSPSEVIDCWKLEDLFSELTR